jgi:hypothetical protein
VVEHVSASEEQDSDQTDSGPEVAVLDDWENVGRGDGQESENTDDSSRDGDDLHVVDRTLDWWVRRVRKMAAEPCVNRLRLVVPNTSNMLVLNEERNGGILIHPERKS